ncbi:GPRC5C isoform 1, partial [Pan troglodytes]
NLCDRSGAWGIVLEAVAGAGIVTTFVLTIILVASLPFVQDTKKRSLLGTQVFFLLGTLGLFCLVFACVVKPDFSTCASRRFLFGVLFAICFSCLAAHVFALNFLARKNHGPRGWVIFTVALLLTLVEVIINTEWLIITLVRGSGEGGPQGNRSAGWAVASPCAIANMDFVMALIYVMLLLLGAFLGAWPALCGRFKRWRKHGVFVLLTTATSVAIWVVWIVMYTYGNKQHNSPTWDDPTLAIALAANAWAFALFYVIPEVSQGDDQSSSLGRCPVVSPTARRCYSHPQQPVPLSLAYFSRAKLGERSLQSRTAALTVAPDLSVLPAEVHEQNVISLQWKGSRELCGPHAALGLA